MNTKLTTILVDDEIDAVNFIRSIISDYCPELEIIATAGSVIDAVRIITEKKPELVFLDVEMPHGSGFDVLSCFPKKIFEVIFITAFNHYAIKAIKFSAVDYLLKPININEFVTAVKKVIEKRDSLSGQTSGFTMLLENLKTAVPKKLAIPTNDGMEYLNTPDIIRVEADGSYCRFFLTDGRKLMVSRNLKEYQELLHDQAFFRPHNSHLINLHLVKKFIRHEGGIVEMIDSSQIPISRGKRELFLSQMAKISK